MHERKARMAELATGFVVLPGGFGTLDETLEILTWNQLGLLAKPVVFLDLEGFFASLFDFFDRCRRRPVRPLQPPPAGPAGDVGRRGAGDGPRPGAGARRTSGSTAMHCLEVDALFDRPAEEGTSLALVVLRHGEIVVERYGVRPPNLFQPEAEPVTAATPLISWSIAKSMTHAAVGHARRRRPDRSGRPGTGARVGGHREGGDHAARPARDALGAGVRRGLRRRRVVARPRHAVRVGRGRPRRVRRGAAAACTRPARCGATRRARRTSSAG